MTDLPVETAPVAPSPEPISDPSDYPLAAEGLRPLDPAYRTVIRTRTAITLGFIAVAVLVGDLALAEADAIYAFSLFAPISALFLWAVIAAPARIWRRLGYRQSEDRLRVVRGNWWSVDTVVPFSRVQHLDVTAGPVERGVGLATLVLHTAGTHNSTVSLPGLRRADAEAMREDIRARIGQG